MDLNAIKAKCAAALAEVEKLAGENATEEKIIAAEKSLEADMKALERAQALDAKAKALAAIPAAVPPKATSGVAVAPKSRAVAQVEAFAKAWAGQRLSGDEEAALVIPKSERMQAAGGLALPDMVKGLMFGKKTADAMGWAKVLSPENDGDIIFRQYLQGLSYIEGENIGLIDKCRVVPAPMGNLYVPRLKRASCTGEWGVSGSWISTGSEKPEDEPIFEQIEIRTYEYTCRTQVVDAMFTRVTGFDLASELARMFRGALRQGVDDAILQGAGAGSLQPQGIVGFAGVGSYNRAVANQVAYADLANLLNQVNPRALTPNCIWVMDQTAKAYIQGLVSTTGAPIFAPSAAGGLFDRLLGYPFIVTVGLPALGTTGDVLIGNFQYYIVALEDDVVIATDEGKGSGFAYNRTNVKAFIRVGGYPVEPDAFANLLTHT